MEAIILAGGKGTRLYPLTKTVPKPMVPVADKPFLEHLLRLIQNKGITDVVMSTGYLGEQIESYFGNTWNHLNIRYVCEDEPLGTGGAIVTALKTTSEDHVFVVNGDTYCDVEYRDVMKFHLAHTAGFTQVLKPMTHFDRYGTVKLDGDKIIRFEEKQMMDEGLINTGVYLLNKTFILKETQKLPKKFSFENDFMQPQLANINAFGFVSEGYFIDIGIPEDLETAQTTLANA